MYAVHQDRMFFCTTTGAVHSQNAAGTRPAADLESGTDFVLLDGYIYDVEAACTATMRCWSCHHMCPATKQPWA